MPSQMYMNSYVVLYKTKIKKYKTTVKTSFKGHQSTNLKYYNSYMSIALNLKIFLTSFFKIYYFF